MTYEERIAGNVTANIKYLQRELRAHSVGELAALINRPASTVYNFISHPTSHSSIKNDLAALAGVSVREFEEELLENIKSREVIKSPSTEQDNPLPLTQMDSYDEEAYSGLMDPEDDRLDDESWLEARNSFLNDRSIHLRLRLHKASEAYGKGDYQEAQMAFESVLFILNSDNYKWMNKERIRQYLDAGKRVGLTDGVYVLADKIISGELHIHAFAAMFSEAVYQYDKELSKEILTSFKK